MRKKKINTIYYFILLIVLLILLLIVYICILNIKNSNTIQNTKIKPKDIPDVKWPFINLQDENGKNINILGVCAHLDDNNKKDFLKYIDNGIQFIGITSYLSFPKKCDNTHGSCHLDKNIKINNKYIEYYVLGWCHCFREPDKYIKGNKPKILLSESDFNAERLKPDNIQIKYDYITVQPIDNKECEVKWNGYNKNWGLAEKSIQILSDDLNLKGLIVGRDNCPINIKKKENIETTDFLNFNKFIEKINMSKFILLPNLEDASPRVITEAMCLNKPLFVNENILGGWKYVNDKTGEFFNENNIKIQAEKILKNINNKQYTPREYYVNNYGNVNSGKRLKQFIQSIYPELSTCEYVKFSI